ncbi:MAG: multi-sensor signal transduction histidine kinase [Rhodocyclaceae bacterium]|nr:MAG: multi-sensor signal transduction histidine kinase [Rhodocyclaceae bacterium]TND00613.1 MAG: multi-sensor signal transduction histidine kinase [Rhodocyclaceae bacterium]
MNKKPVGTELGAFPLRAAAEERCADGMTETPARPAPESAHELLHELQVHRIELEMQNETLRQSQIALEESRDRYIEFYDFAPVGYLTLTDQGLIAEINLTGAAMLGMDRARLLQHRFSPSVTAEDQDRWHLHFVGALRLDEKLDCDVTLLRPDGSRLEVRLDSLRLTKEDKSSMLRVVLTDITERKRVQETLRASEQSFHDYTDLSADWYWEQDANFRFTHMSGGVFNKGGFRVADSLGKTRWELPIESVGEEQWAEHRALLGRHEVFHDFTYSVRVADGTQRWYLVSGKPVFAPDGEFLGYRGIGRDISERKRAEAALRDSEQRFRDYAELSADWFWEQDADLRFSRLSGGANNTEEGIRVAAILGKTRWELPIEGVDDSDWVAHRALLARREIFKDFVYGLRVADGSLRWFSVSGKPVFAADGEFAGYRGSTHDITDRRRAQEAQQASEQRFRDYAELSADWFWEQDAEFRFTEVSYGAGIRPMVPPFSDRKSVGRHRWDLHYVNVPDGFWDEHRRLLEAGQPFNNLRLQRRDGDVARHVELSGRPLFDGLGRLIGYRGTGRDITEQVISRERLEKTLRWLEQAVRAGGIGLWERDIATWTFRFRDNWRALFGYAADEINDTAAEFDRLVHPDDLARIQAAGRAHVESLGSAYEIRFRVRHKDGSWRWVLSRGEVMSEPVTGQRIFVGCHLDITRQMRNEEALHASEQRFRDYADLAADWFWEQDADLRFTAMYGGSGHESPGTLHAPSDTIGKHAWELPYVDAPEGFWDAHRQLLAAHQAFADLPFGYRKPDGSMRYVLVSGKPIFDAAGRFTGYCGVGHDITEQVVSREKLEKTQRWLEQAVRAGSIGLWERDVDGWALGFTNNWKSLFGYAEDEIGSGAEDFDRLVHPDDLERVHAVARAYADNPHGEYESRFRIRHKDGSWRWVLSRGNVLTDAATGERTWMGSHIDITNQMQAEQKIAELAALLETRVKARTAELEEANRELDAFNFSVSHDLRTPLRAIEGFSQALLEDCDEQLDQTGREYLRRICKSTARMGELIDALYELSRMARAPLHLGPVDLSAIAQDLVVELRGQDPQRAVAIEIAATPLAQGDARLLRIVLTNLLGNAWKFTAKTGPARIVLGAQRDEEGRVIYFLRDNGVGFDMQFADKLFRVFHRLHREEEFPGQGVGLTTVQRIVARHGGRVWGEAERGAGATFYFTLWTDTALLADAQGNIEDAEVQLR